MDLSSEAASVTSASAAPSFPHKNVYVKNTFIQVRDPHDLDASFPFTRHKPAHKRCASEPLWSVQTTCHAHESMSLPPTTAEGDESLAGLGFDSGSSVSPISRERLNPDERAAFEISTTASSPQNTHREGSTAPSELDAASSSCQDSRRSHVRQWSQLSTQTADSFDMEVTHWENHRAALDISTTSSSPPLTHRDDSPPELDAASVGDEFLVPPCQFRQPSPFSMHAGDNFEDHDYHRLYQDQECILESRVVGGYAASTPKQYLAGGVTSLAATPVMDRSAVLSTSPSRPESNVTSVITDSEAAEVMASYSRGVAAGFAQTAFARGFAAGAAAAVTTMGVIPPRMTNLTNNQEPAQAVHPACAEPISLDEALSEPTEAIDSTLCQMFWCDPRAFKETALKEQLELEMRIPVKCYRTAEMCMRLLRKKHTLQGKIAFRVFLVSWSNAPSLVSFLAGERSTAYKVIVLCDTCANRGCGRATTWAQQHPGVEVVYTWSQAVDTIKRSMLHHQRHPC